MAKTPKSKPVTDQAAKSAAVTAANAAALAPQDAPAPLAELTADALQARADEWDAAREALKAAGETAAAAQAALDALPKDATDEQRDDALRALADAENAVKTAQGVIEKLSLPEAFGIPGSSADAIVVPTEAGLAVTIEPGAAYAPAQPEEPLSPRSQKTLADIWFFGGAETAKVRVTGPKAGRWRAGVYWGSDPVEVDISLDTYQALKADPQFTVEILDDGT